MATRNASPALDTTPLTPTVEADHAQVAPVEMVGAESLTSQAFEIDQPTDAIEKVELIGERMTPEQFIMSLNAVIATETDIQAWLATATLAELTKAGDIVKDNEIQRKKLANQISQTRKGRGIAADSELGDGRQVTLTTKGIKDGKVPVPVTKEKGETDQPQEPQEPALTGMPALFAVLATLDSPDLDKVIEHANKLKALALAKADLGL